MFNKTDPFRSSISDGIYQSIPLLLFSSWPFVNFLNVNRMELSYIPRILVIWMGFVILCLSTFILLRYFFPKLGPKRIANSLAIFCAFLFSYLVLSQHLITLGVTQGRVRLLLWLGLTVVAVSVVWVISRNRATTPVLVIVGLVMTGSPAFQFLFHLAGTRGVTEIERHTQTEAGGTQRSNVYWFILDMYTRQDFMLERLNFDNSKFLKTIEDKGFSVASASFANYNSTKITVSTMLNMDYYLPVDTDLDPHAWTNKLQGFNKVIQRFRRLGYSYIHAEPGGSTLKTRCGGGEDRCISGQAQGFVGISEAEVGLLKLTPLFPVIRRIAPDLLSFDFTTLNDIMSGLSKEKTQPFFLFAHILSPHPPARYNADCSRRASGSWDLVVEGGEKATRHYLTDVTCLNQEVVAAMDVIIDRDGSDPIIILQGDHGISFKVPTESGSEQAERWTDPEQLLAILNAMRLPVECKSKFYDSMSSVNTFRLVFSCLDRTPFEPIPDRHFLLHERKSLMGKRQYILPVRVQ